MSAYAMRPRSTVTYRRPQWQHNAKQRADRERYQRPQTARLSAERDRTTQALQAAQARRQPREAHRRPREAHRHRQVSLPTVEVVLVSLHLFFVARIGFRAVSRVLSLLAGALGSKHAPGPQPVLHGVPRLAMVRTQAARLLQGLPRRQVPLRNGLLGLIARSMGLGTGQILAVLAVAAQHHQLVPSALSLDRVHGLGVSGAEAWTGDTLADRLDRLIAQMGRPAADLNDGGRALHKAVATLKAPGLGSPCLDARAHAVAGRRTRTDQAPPAVATCLPAGGQGSGTLQPTLLACWAPPKVRTKARCMPVHRLCPWAEQVLPLSPAGGAKPGSACAKLRACLEQWPACQALITRFRPDAHGLLAGQKMLQMQGRSHNTRAPCEPLIATRSSCALRQAFRASLACELETATTRGREHVGGPSSSDAIASLCGVAKRPGVGEPQEAHRMALRLPTCCGVPTREEAEQGLRVRGARQHERPAQGTSLSTQRREVLGPPEHLARLSLAPATPHVERMPRPKNRSNYQAIINISKGYEACHGPPLPSPGRLHGLENAAPPGRTETALTS